MQESSAVRYTRTRLARLLEAVQTAGSEPVHLCAGAPLGVQACRRTSRSRRTYHRSPSVPYAPDVQTEQPAGCYDRVNAFRNHRYPRRAGVTEHRGASSITDQGRSRQRTGTDRLSKHRTDTTLSPHLSAHRSYLGSSQVNVDGISTRRSWHWASLCRYPLIDEPAGWTMGRKVGSRGRVTAFCQQLSSLVTVYPVSVSGRCSRSGRSRRRMGWLDLSIESHWTIIGKRPEQMTDR